MDRNLVPNFGTPAMVKTHSTRKERKKRIAEMYRTDVRSNLERARDRGKELCDLREECRAEGVSFLDDLKETGVKNATAHRDMRIWLNWPLIEAEISKFGNLTLMQVQKFLEEKMREEDDEIGDGSGIGDGEEPGVESTTESPSDDGPSGTAPPPAPCPPDEDAYGNGDSTPPSTDHKPPPTNGPIWCADCLTKRRKGQELPKKCDGCKSLNYPRSTPTPSGNGHASREPATPRKPSPPRERGSREQPPRPAFDWIAWDARVAAIRHDIESLASRYNAPPKMPQKLQESFDAFCAGFREWTASLAKDLAPPTPIETGRSRDALFDAVAKVTGSDPKLNGSHIGKACRQLREADPPYTAEEVLALPVVLGKMKLTFSLATPSAVVNHIGKVRTFKNGKPQDAGLQYDAALDPFARSESDSLAAQGVDE
jgi:hypothetical protein